MHINGAVEATRTIRDQKLPLTERIQLAEQILHGKLSIILPRKETMVLEWIFDTLQIDPNASSEISIWQLLSRIWPKVALEARFRVFKNHKFISSLIQGMSLPAHSSSWAEILTTVFCQIAENVPIFNGSTDQQVSQVILSYLALKKSLSLPYSGIESTIFENCKSRKGLFNKCNAHDLLLLIFAEPDYARNHYLVEFFKFASNPVVPSDSIDDDHLKALVLAIGEAQVNVPDRILELSRVLPQKTTFILKLVHIRMPQVISVNLMRGILDYLCSSNKRNWDVVQFTLEVSPNALLDNEAQLASVIRDCPPEILALCLVKLSQQRKLMEFLENWIPKKVDLVIMTGLSKAMDSLSAPQISFLIESQPPSIHFIIQSLKFSAVSNPVVKRALEKFYPTTKNIETKLLINQLLPQNEWKKENHPVLLLRNLETDLAKVSQKELESAFASINSELSNPEKIDNLVLRFFPSLEKCLDHSALSCLINKCSQNIRYQLARCPNALEIVNISNALIDSAIEHRELANLVCIPKSLFSWKQRHCVVAMAIKNFTFGEAGRIVADLIDYQHLPDPLVLSAFVSNAIPNQCSTIIDLCTTLKKDTGYIKKVISGLKKWQKVLVECEIGVFNEGNLEWLANESRNFITPLTHCLKMLPNSPFIEQMSTRLALKTLNTPEFKSELFQLIIKQDYHWSVICALYVSNNHKYESEFAQYLDSIKHSDLEELLFVACEESHYGILRSLARYHHINDSHQKLVSYVVLNAIKLNECGSEFWEFLDYLLRSPSSQLLGQFALEAALGHVSQNGTRQHWDLSIVIISRFLLFKRQAFRNKFHLFLSALTAVLLSVRTTHQADGFTRLVDNLVNPSLQTSKKKSEKHELSSQIAKERRYLSRIAGILLHNIILVILGYHKEPSEESRSLYTSDWTAVTQALKPATFLLVDLLQSDGLKASSAAADNATRAYFKKLYEDYKLYEKWTSD